MNIDGLFSLVRFHKVQEAMGIFNLTVESMGPTVDKN